jgi:hypothetical protein
LGREISAVNRKAQADTQGALLFFLLSLGWEGFFSFFPGFPICSHYVPFKFPMGTSQYVPQVPDVFFNMFSIAPHFYPICFGNVVLLSSVYLGQRGGTLYFAIETSDLVAFVVSFSLE